MKAAEPKIMDFRKALGVALIAVLFLVLAIPAARFTVGNFYYQQGVSLSEKSSYS